MAEQVNQRIEGMINELEQMRRTHLYEDDEIKEISRKRKEFEYRIQRRIKDKQDFVQYIAFELALLEDISLRRKQAKVTEKKNDIEYAIAKRLNKVFKQFVFRYHNVEIYFEYIKFCRSVGFNYAVSAIIGQMLQIHGDKPKMWQMASKWESKEQNNLDNARNFLLKGIHRHPDSEILYLDLFEIELMAAFQADSEEEKDKCLKRADVVWRNGMKNIPDINYLFKICDVSMKYGIDDTITNSIREEIWNRRTDKSVWSYIANKELEVCEVNWTQAAQDHVLWKSLQESCVHRLKQQFVSVGLRGGSHWAEIEEFVNDDFKYPAELKNYIGVYEEALQQFPDENLCTKYIHGLLNMKDSVCTELQKINTVKHAWYYGHENGLLTNEMYTFGICMLKLEDEMPKDEYTQILDAALAKNPQCRLLWEEKLVLNKSDENNMLSILKDAGKILKSEDILSLWNFIFDNVDSKIVFNSCYDKFRACESTVILSLKPKLLQKIYDHNGLKYTRQIYEDFIRTPPTQSEVHKVMIGIEMSQEKPALKNIRKCYEAFIQHHGHNTIEVWMDYINFEQNNGSVQAVPALHRRAIGMLQKDLVDGFIKAQTLAKLK